MIRFTSLSKAILLATCILSQQLWAQEAPAEKTVLQLSRVAGSGNQLGGSLSKNLMKQEEYQAPYTVQIPYQVEETYVENVPYTVEVPYTDYITEYRQEYRCHSVTRYRQECRNEQRCYTVPGTPGQCRIVRECGTNVQGQPICKDRQVCDGGSGPQQRCDYQNVCRQVPYTDQQCGYEQVAYQTPVTRYRTETRYRQETRTRTVTKYRDEQRCCVTKTRDVFDRQLQFQVDVHFPQEAVLLANESELLNVILVSADDKSAQVQLQEVNTVFGYRIANQSVSGATIHVELALVPKFNLSNAGTTTIQNLLLQYVKEAGKKFQLSFNDSVSSARVSTTYKVVITDEAGNKVEEQTAARPATGATLLTLNNVTDKKAKIKATITVQRTGILVENSQILFDVSVLATKK